MFPEPYDTIFMYVLLAIICASCGGCAIAFIGMVIL